MSKKTAKPQLEILPLSTLSVNKTLIKEQSEIDKLINMNFTVQDTPNCGNEKFSRQVVTSNGECVFFGNSKTKVLQTSEIERLQNYLIEKAIQFNMSILKIGDYSLQAVFKIQNQPQEIVKGDIINPSIILTISGDMQHPNGFDIAGDRVICGNGLTRTTIESGVSEETVNLALASLASNAVKYRRLAESKLEWVDIQNTLLTEEIVKTGYPKGFVEIAHNYLAMESKHANDLNKWLLYNSLNKVIFEEIENSLNYKRKKEIDNRIFELIENLNLTPASV